MGTQQLQTTKQSSYTEFGSNPCNENAMRKHIYIDLYGIWADLLLFWDDMYSDILGVQENHKKFSFGSFAYYYQDHFDYLDMTRS